MQIGTDDYILYTHYYIYIEREREITEFELRKNEKKFFKVSKNIFTLKSFELR